MADLVQLSEPWRKHLGTISAVLNKAPRVRWDRCIDDGGGVLHLYGWVDRDDGRADFVLLNVQRYSDVDFIDYAFYTSSPDAELTAELAKAIGITMDVHIPCKRIEEVFGGMVTNAIKLAPKTCDCEAAINGSKPGTDWLMGMERQDGEIVECPDCGKQWVHVCDEAEGCTWVPA
ncbi:MAG TPA: hypothetical protein VNG04_05810 [Candidatus Acidoferrum sp.]|nr:hypothetical protein [Candidatus Acidoferrum sp.]